MKKINKKIKATCSLAAACILSLVSCADSKQNGVSGSNLSNSIYTEEDLVWQEDFNELNLNDWNFEFHEKGWVNNELQSYDDSSENTYVKDGYLIIQPLKGMNADHTLKYTSGRINTQGKHTFKYGRIEARLKVPQGQGFLPAFWMMPDDESFYGQWPKCGEIDIMEVLGNQIDTVYGTLHFGEPHQQKQGTYTLKKGNFADQFHVFALEWDPGEMRFYCDGVLYKTVDDWFTKWDGYDEKTFPAPYDQPYYLILNVAVGGSWPGNPNSTTPFDEKAQMVVDYVKVYQKPSYNENVEKKEDSSVSASLVGKGNLVTGEKDGWTFLTAGNGVGSADVKSGNVTIKTEKEGTLEYSIQLVSSSVPMVKGTKYRYSFDAYADQARTLITGITAPDNGYVRHFGDEKITVGTEKKHYEYEFVMAAKTDGNCRLEYNLGSQGSTATVYISNIVLEAIEEIDLNAGAKSVLPNGNYIHNGTFDSGKARLGDWETAGNAVFSVTNENLVRQFKAEMNETVSGKEDVSLFQNGISLNPGKDYILTFDAYASKDSELNVSVDKLAGKASLTTEKKSYTYRFVSGKTKTEGKLLFNLGAKDTTVYIDNVVLKEDALLVNGDFKQKMIGWEVYHNDEAKVTDEVDENGFKMVIEDTGSADWNIQLKQNGVLLENGKTYTLSFKAKCSEARTIMFALQRDGSGDDNWIPYSGTQKIDVGPEYHTYSVTFKMDNATDSKTILSISTGAVNGKRITSKHTIRIQDVSLKTVN